MPQIEPSDRAREFVRIMTSGGRTSLNRGWRMAGFQNHHPSIGQILRSPSFIQAFGDAVDDGRILPQKYAARIITAIAAADVAALQ